MRSSAFFLRRFIACALRSFRESRSGASLFAFDFRASSRQDQSRSTNFWCAIDLRLREVEIERNGKIVCLHCAILSEKRRGTSSSAGAVEREFERVNAVRKCVGSCPDAMSRVGDKAALRRVLSRARFDKMMEKWRRHWWRPGRFHSAGDRCFLSGEHQQLPPVISSAEAS